MRVLLLVGSILAIAACDESPREVPVSPRPPVATSDNSVAGVTWDVPATWSAQPERAMRVATYELPGNGAAPGECAVFHFPATGGSVEANISRWARQFEGSVAPTIETREVAGLSVTLVSISGTYLAPGGPMMKSTGKKPDYQLFGAIVPAPQGNVFFKATGPAATLAANREAFDALVASVRPGT